MLETLQPSLSQGATVSSDTRSRWSTYKAPNPVAVVKVNDEADVAATVSQTQENRCFVTHSDTSIEDKILQRS
jgi:hypothetical protein